IKADALKINKIALGISEAVYDSIKDPETEYGVPLGNAIGSRFFAGKGPKIPVRLTQINAVSYEIKSDLISGGINQTVHRISVRYTVTVKCLAPFNENLIIINGEQIIAETVIIGEVPEILLRETG
ncbi:MAG: sporulation protein YunB, partial [Clostridia bacterium]|nr:sporulation protein YunB [Clostridia bacterium]